MNGNGGVANHFLGLKNKYSVETQYYYIGGHRKSVLIKLIYLKIMEYLGFIKQIVKYNPDIVHLNPSLCLDATLRDAIYLFISKIFKIKVLVFWHGWNTSFANKIETKYSRIFAFVYNNADAFVVLSSEFRSKLLKLGIKKNIYISSTKVDDSLIDNFDINTKVKNEYVLFMSRIEKDKGIYGALEIFKRLKEQRKNLHLLIAGTGPEYSNISSYIKKSGITDVKLLGFVTGQEKIEIMEKSSILLFPTYHGEGMPTVVLEAMAFGIAIVTSPIGGLVDFFQNGEMGYLIDSYDIEEYVNKILLLLNNDKIFHHISFNNHIYAKKEFLASVVAKKLEHIYTLI